MELGLSITNNKRRIIKENVGDDYKISFSVGGVFDHENCPKVVQDGPKSLPHRFWIDKKHFKKTSTIRPNSCLK